MRTKIFLLSGVLLGLIYLAGCDDAIDQVGMGIQPDGNKVIVFDDSLDITSITLKDPVLYAKSIYGLLGNFYDKDYGELKAGYICQFYPDAGFGTKENMDSIVSVDSIQLKILYTTYVGDSLSPMEVSVYPVRKETPLPQDYYTNLNPSDYCSMDKLLGKQAYTARDLNISDSLNQANITANNYKLVSVDLPKGLAQQFYEEYQKADHGAYASPAAMADFFPGVYVKPTFGSGCILNVEKTDIIIYYTRRYETTDTLQVVHSDTRVQTSVLEVTKEVIQLNQYTGSNEEKLLNPADEKNMYLKTPAGIFAQLTIPITEIKQKIGNRKFSNVRLSIEAEPKEDWEYALDFPGMGTASSLALTRSKLLLIEPDSIKRFFEEKKTADGQTSFFTTFNKTTYSYTFDNISNVIQYAIDKGFDKLELRLVPVQVAYYEYSSSYSYSTSYIDYTAAHYLAPSAVTLKKDNLKIKIIAADLKR
ncbi:hypothetical protein FACS189428_0300 [Clostridia bacterium]|nr:hypothetical protein FACS189428_0300 [Clostridia bacterium]